MAKRKHRKTFPCGHRGHGQECKRCQQEAEAAAKKAKDRLERQRHKEDWVASFDQDPIDLRRLPKPIVIKSRDILAELQTGTHFKTLGGKRMKPDRTVVRIPVGHRYRMICRDYQGQITPLSVLSHEDYNTYASNPHRIR